MDRPIRRLRYVPPGGVQKRVKVEQMSEKKTPSVGTINYYFQVVLSEIKPYVDALTRMQSSEWNALEAAAGVKMRAMELAHKMYMDERGMKESEERPEERPCDWNHWSNGVEAIAKERVRQVTEEGYDEAHDKLHECSELAWAAKAYLRAYLSTDGGGLAGSEDWPWEMDGFKPATKGVVGHIRDLERAGALIAAQIDRLVKAGLVDPRD